MLSFLLMIALMGVTLNAPIEDLIINLPELTWNLNYQMYAGYLDLANGHHLFYWFTESANDPATDPVILWLNGGPGCSSLDGLLYEIGPIHINNDDNTLNKNPYSWNLNASIIFLESPICVGFSYSDDMKCSANDNTTADDNYLALVQFFVAKFPEYLHNDFFVMGESYAGVYVPVTVKKILDENADKSNNITINLKGFAVGDPCGFETIKYFDSDMWYEYYHGWISEQNWNKMLNECCEPNKTYIHQNCHFGNPQNLKCAELVADATKIIKDGSINWNDWIVDCYRNYINQTQNGRLMKLLFDRAAENNKFFKEIGLNQDIENQVYTICGDSNGAYNYLNRMDVRNAIHVNRSIVNDIEWNICSDTLNYTVLEMYDNEHWLYNDILNMSDDIYIMVYNGDVDAGINLLVSQWFVDNLTLPIVKEYGEWFIDEQVGGWRVYYDRVSFVTLRGAGHEVPKYRPKESLKMFQHFIQTSSL